MNREQTKKAIEVMQAYADGKQVEISVEGGRWKPVGGNGPKWAWDYCKYRIKPEPREGYVIEVEGHPVRVCFPGFKWNAGSEAAKHPFARTIKFREVMEDE